MEKWKIDSLPEIFHPWKDKLLGGIFLGSLENGEERNLSFSSDESADQVLKYRAAFCQQLQLPKDSYHSLQQCHGSRVITLPGPEQQDCRGKTPPQADGMLSNEKGILMAVYAADCVPILVYDPEKHCAAALHGGWKGCYSEIAPQGLRQMTRLYKSAPQDVRVWMGPAIGSCCYQVDQDLAEKFQNRFGLTAPPYIEKRNGSWYLDLREIHKWQLIKMGVPAHQISCDTHCSYCNKREYPSYRREKEKAGRMTAFLSLK